MYQSSKTNRNAADYGSAMEQRPFQKRGVSENSIVKSRSKFCLAVVAALLLFCGKPVSVYATDLVSSFNTHYTFSSEWKVAASATLTLSDDINSYTFDTRAGYTYHFTLGSSCCPDADNCKDGELVIEIPAVSDPGQVAAFSVPLPPGPQLPPVIDFPTVPEPVQVANDKSSCDGAPYVTLNCTYANARHYQLRVKGTKLGIPTFRLGFKEVPNTYTITLDQQSGTGGTSSITAIYDAAMPISDAAMPIIVIPPTRTGYIFGGYYTSTNGGGTQYYTESMGSARNWDRTSNTTLYAKWTPIIPPTVPWEIGRYSAADVTAIYYDGTLTISGTGYMKNFEYMRDYPNDGLIADAPWKDFMPAITKVVISEGVTGIGAFTFYNCSSLTEVTIPSSVREIGTSAFVGCTGLTDVIVNRTTPPLLVFGSAFSIETLSNVKLSVPNGSCAAYSTASYWSYFNFSCGSQTPYTPPTVTTLAVTNITQTTATLNKFVTAGSETIIEQGFKYKQSSASLWNISTSGSLTGLTAGTQYQFYAYATTASGTTNGSTLTFTTRPNGEAAEKITWQIGYPNAADVIATLNLADSTLTISGTGAMANNTPPWYSQRENIKTVVINSGVTSIGTSAFSNCSGLTSVTIPNSVKSIGGAAFSETGLTSVTIPESVTSIGGNGHLVSGSNLTTVNFNAINCERPDADGGNLIIALFDGPSFTTLNIGNNVTKIPFAAVAGCNGLTSVTIPNSVMTIGAYAFRRCNGLQSITIPNSVTTIGVSAFDECVGLTSATIGNSASNSVQIIGGSAFWHCKNLASVTIGNSVKSIGSYAFADCTALTSITIPDSVKSIGGAAFSETSLTSITIPNSVTSIDDSAFFHCKLSNIIVSSGNTSYKLANNVGNGKMVIPYNASEFNGTNTVGSLVCGNITIPNSVTTIGESAFRGCSGLTSIIISNSVTTIGESAFTYCDGLTSITISNSVTSIKNWAFRGCIALTDVTVLWATPLSISIDRFSEVTLSNVNLYVPAGKKPYYKTANVWKEFNIVEDSPTVITLTATNITQTTAMLNKSVTAGNETIIEQGFKYKQPSASSWNISTSGNLTELTANKLYQFYAYATTATGTTNGTTLTFTTGDVVTWEIGYPNAADVIATLNLADGTLTISGIGAMANYSIYETDAPWYSQRENIKTLVITNSVTSIGDRVFYGCSGLTSVNITNSVTSIGDLAFWNCSGLTSVTIGNSVTSIGKQAFYYCTSLKELTIADGSSTLDFGTPYSVFGDCPLETVYLGRNISYNTSSYSNSPFYQKTTIKEVVIGNSVTSIGSSAFSNCSGLTDVTVNWTTPILVNSNVFSGVSLSNVNLHIPENSCALYAAAPVWKDSKFACSQIIDFQAIPEKIYGDAAITLPQKTNANLAISYQSSNTDVATVAGNTLTITGAGTANITATQNSATHFTAATPVTQILTVGKAPLTVTADNKTRKYGEANPQFTLSYSGFKNGENEGVLDLLPTASCPANEISLAENYVITLSGGNDNNYIYTLVNGKLTVEAVTGINNVVANQLQIYPNPVKDEIFIKSDLQIQKVEIYALSGALLLSENNFNEKISVSALPKGVYLLKVYSDKDIAVSKIVKE